MRFSDFGSGQRVCALVAVVGVLAVWVPAAWGSKGVVDSFGEAAITAAGGVAVNQATGDVYVADSGQRVLQFSSAGEFIRAWGWGVASGAEAFEVCTSSCLPGLQGGGDGQLGLQTVDPQTFGYASTQVAVDQADGSVYVADTLNNRVQKFSATGAFLDAFGTAGSQDGQLNAPEGVAVDGSSEDVLVADTANNRVQRFTSAGSFVSTIGTTAGSADEGEFMLPRRVAVDSTGRLYVLDDGNVRVQRFTTGGAFDQVFGSSAVVPFSSFEAVSDMAIDTSNDHVYVSGISVADLATRGIVEMDPDGAAVDVHAADAGFYAAGLAVRTSTGRIYASQLGGQQVMALDEVAAPVVTIDPVGVGPEGATFSGSVDPEGPPSTAYRFEYSSDGSTWVSVPLGGVEVGSGTEPVAVSQTTDDLEPNIDYRVRLVATKSFNAGSATSDEVAFRTDAVAPAVRALAAGGRGSGAAWLGGEVNPHNSATSYYIEYAEGVDVGYAGSEQIPLAPVGAGNGFVTVTQLVTGLQAGTEYRFRVVAANAAGTTVGPDRVFRTREAAPEAPKARGYEMVSPLEKNGGDIDRTISQASFTSSGAAASGDAVAYVSPATFAGVEAGVSQGQYRSERHENGWVTKGINPPVVPLPDLLASRVLAFSDDLSKGVVKSNALLSEGAEDLGNSFGLYLQHYGGSALDYDLLTVPSDPLPPVVDGATQFEYVGATDDMRHVVFESEGRQLTPDGLPPDSGRGVYIRSEGQVRFVSKLSSGEPLPFARGGAGPLTGQFFPGDHLVSDDGKRVYFTTDSSAAPVYVNESTTGTEILSVSEREEDEGEDPPFAQPGRFQAAKADDGALALFTSHVRLTDDATACDAFCPEGTAQDLYLWNANAGVGERLTDLTTADPGGGGVLGIAAAADDLSRVFFVARGELADGAVPGRPNLYAWTAGGGVEHVATLAAFADPSDLRSSPDAGVWAVARSLRDGQYRDARLSDDGTRLLFTSHARLTAEETGSREQVYLYDAAVDGGGLMCVSCPPDGSAPEGDAWLFYPPELGPNASTRAPEMPLRLPRNLSADGTRAFFETTSTLVEEDTNGKADVYMWSGGEVSLISSGEGGFNSELVDVSASGNDVFFTTRERLVGWDTDNQVDVYDARVGGGFPEPVASVKCVGDECQGTPAERPVLSEPDSTQAAGDPRITRSRLVLKRLSVRQRAALAAGRRVALVVRVNKAGRVVVRGTGRLLARNATVLRSSKRVSKAGTVRLPLRLSKPARSAVSRSGRLRVLLTARFAGEREVLSLGLVRASREGRGR